MTFNQIKIQQFFIRHANRILALLLLSLHAFLVMNQESGLLSRSLFVCHYGLFLMWQPIWQQNQKMTLATIAGVAGVGVVAFYFINWWLAGIWLAMLFGLLGGRIFSDDAKKNRVVHIMAAIYLLSMLLIWVVPVILGGVRDSEAMRIAAVYVLPVLPAVLFFIPHTQDNATQLPFLDFFYTVMLTLLAFILALASYAVGTIQALDYLQVILVTMFGLALTLVVLSLLWKPSMRFSGVELMMSRYLTSVGMPFERWVRNIAALGDIETKPSSFVESAMQEMQSLPWVAGLYWMADEASGKLGTVTQHSTEFTFKDFHMTLYTPWPISPALYMHVKLLTQIMGEFYVAKRREETLRQNAYMQAFYETGSRLTHDIKNILQSTGTLVAAAEQTDDSNSEALLKLIRRQLPMLNQRISNTLDKLRAPGEERQKMERIAAWWKNLQLRHHRAQIEFIADKLPMRNINAEVLDSILDNLLSNALEKIKYQPGTLVAVSMVESEELGFYVDVTDTGKAMAESIAKSLFVKHINSSNGLGVGLYHAAQDAKQAGYELSLVSNQTGRVTFRVRLVFEETYD